MLLSRIIPLAVLSAALLPGSAPASDLLGQCVIKRQAQFEAPQIFRRTSRVTCPASDVVGFPPRQRRHNREADLSYSAPEGYDIEHDNSGSIRVDVLSSNNGRNGAVILSEDGRSVSVEIACDGLPQGEGEAWHEVQLEGEILRLASESQKKSWLLDCAHEVYVAKRP